MTKTISESTTSTPTGFSWAVAAIEHDAPAHRTGHTDTHPAAWTAALAAGRAALLAGQLDTLAVRINGQLDATYDPGRDEYGRLDEAAVTRALVDLHQAATGRDVAAALSHASAPGTPG